MRFFTPQKHMECFGFLMFAGDIEMQQLAEMSLAQFFGPNGSYFVRK